MRATQPPRSISRIGKFVWDALSFADSKSMLSRCVSYFIVALIFLNVIAVLLETFDQIEARYSRLLDGFELFSVMFFSVEYLLRISLCHHDPRYSKPITGRIKYALTPLALVDLLAILPFYVCLMKIDLRFIRLFRLIRIFRLFKMTRYSKALNAMMRVLSSKKEELAVSFAVLFLFLLAASCFLYHFEHTAQPDTFPNIFSAMWCALSTFTFIGNGDIYPITVPGRLFIAIIGVLCVGVFGVPAGIITSGFMDELNKKKEKGTCPHCGKEI
jgi:voltage-gated potassium channel